MVGCAVCGKNRFLSNMTDRTTHLRIARMLRKRDTWVERLMWRWLRDRRFSRFKFRRQHVFGPFILDFFCFEAQLNIELDGGQHGAPDSRSKDCERDQWLNDRGVKVLRIWNSRLRREPEVVRNTIWTTLQECAPQQPPSYCNPLMQSKPTMPSPFPTREQPPISPRERAGVRVGEHNTLAKELTETEI